MKLHIELIPSTCWYINLRNAMGQQEWDKLRKSVYAEYEHRCGICGSTGRMNCHEIWEYDDKKHIQTLKGFISLCNMCHHIKHIGHTEVLISEGKLNYKDVLMHFTKVNSCTEEKFREEKARTYKEWNERSKYAWVLELGKYKQLIRGMP